VLTADGRVVRRGDAGNVEFLGVETLREGVDHDLVGGEGGVEERRVARDEVEVLRFGLARARRQEHPVVPAPGGFCFEFGDDETGKTLAAMGRGGPDALEFRGAFVEPLERTPGDRDAVTHQNDESTVRCREGIDRVPGDLGGGAFAEVRAVAGVVLRGEVREQRLGEGVVGGDVDEGVLRAGGGDGGCACEFDGHGVPAFLVGSGGSGGERGTGRPRWS